eukprot:gene17164-19664_t
MKEDGEGLAQSQGMESLQVDHNPYDISSVWSQALNGSMMLRATDTQFLIGSSGGRPQMDEFCPHFRREFCGELPWRMVCPSVCRRYDVEDIKVVMKGSNLNQSLVQRLRDNTIAYGGIHYLDVANSNIGPREISGLGDVMRINGVGGNDGSPII